MASFVQIIGEALQTYWLSPLSLTVLAVCGASMGTLLYVFFTNARNTKLRVSLLTGLYALSIFFWAFVAGSLVLCVSQARMVAYAKNGVPLARLVSAASKPKKRRLGASNHRFVEIVPREIADAEIAKEFEDSEIWPNT